ncbi:hypothetical protein BLNAU_2341 [Blattamonas nauphoetae]|uniref:Uncharacterized protein n=1 Tax=Blattamonas nauphoetae TaxID=2049346 RepID=A0ABQ9YG10_9EUKA|nr:hypothetical protein BLNAU_2341 [Blattamonas nauphoetae]
MTACCVWWRREMFDVFIPTSPSNRVTSTKNDPHTPNVHIFQSLNLHVTVSTQMKKCFLWIQTQRWVGERDESGCVVKWSELHRSTDVRNNADDRRGENGGHCFMAGGVDPLLFLQCTHDDHEG